jgi:flagellar hook-associated protein 3 FlgL
MGSIRVNPYQTPDLLASLDQLKQQQDTATIELATGSRINRPSDDPAGAAQLSQLSDISSQADSFQKSIASLTNQLSTADATFSSLVTVLQRAISLGVQGGNGTLSDSDRAAIAVELTSIQSEVLNLANTSYQGHFIFAGTATVQPFVLDPLSSSGVSYKGNVGTNKVSIGQGYQLQVNLAGSQIFNGAGADVFQSIQDLITSLNTNTGIPAAVTEVGTAFSYVTGQRVFYGNALNQTQTQQTYLATQNLGLAQQQNAVGAADIATVASQLVADQTARTATLDAIGRVPQTSLFDFLK